MKQIGYIKTIHPEYVDFYFDVQQVSNYEKDTIPTNELLQSHLSNESKKRIQTMLNNIYSSVFEEVNSAIHYPSLSKENKACYFYTLSCLAYPFFRDTVEYLGRQFRLNEYVTTVQVTSHMKKLYGDRRRVEIAVSSILSSLYYWNLVNRPKVGQYSAISHLVDFSFHYTIMIEVLMTAQNHTSITQDMLEHSSIFFPFDYHVSISTLNHSPYRIIRSMSDTIIEKKS